MFSSTAEYALRAVAFLAQSGEKLSSSQTIAEHTRVPQGYLLKVLNDLVNAGIVVSRRGPHGGFALGRDPGRLSVLDVINAVDPIQRIRECPLGLKAHKSSLCRLHRRMDEAIAMVEKALADSTIADMVHGAGPGEVFPLDRRPITPSVRGRSPR